MSWRVESTEFATSKFGNAEKITKLNKRTVFFYIQGVPKKGCRVLELFYEVIWP